nr:MAG TPA_asm: hypothetical protein [Caudoviricetes sp.]
MALLIPSNHSSLFYVSHYLAVLFYVNTVNASVMRLINIT